MSQAGDALEREADQIAERVMRMPQSNHPRAAEIKEGAGLRVSRYASGSTSPSHAVPPVVHEVLRSSGEPLDGPTRTFMESQFDHDFAHVRVHTGREATESASRINARAYTVGGHVVFGAGEYAPTSSAGRRLLAHELAHVMQQGGPGAGVVQRAEVDDRSCAGLTDIETDIDTQVQSEIAAARTAAGSPLAVPAFLRDVATRLGGFTPVSPIERFIEGLPASKRNLPGSSLAGTKYSGVSAVNRFYHLQTLGLAHVVGSAAKVHGICVGADKLGHFFEEGFVYFDVASAGGSTALTESLGQGLEIGIQGLASTGVFSNADRAANRAGKQFYQDLQANPSGLTFGIKSYITAQWNEQSNPSFYESGVAEVVWSNLLTGAWEGSFTSAGGTSTPIDLRANLTATASGSVTGTYQWPKVNPAQIGNIKNGTITQRTTGVSGTAVSGGALSPVSATPVSGVSIEFDWEEGTASGKGKWDSVDEQTLDGTWGIGASRTSGGNWHQKKV